MKKLIITKIAIILAVVMAVVILSCSSCTKAPQPNVVEVNIQGTSIVYNYAYGYEGKIYAIKDESTTILNIGARRLYYIQGASVYTDTITTMTIGLNKGYYNGSASTLNSDNMNIINIKNEKR